MPKRVILIAAVTVDGYIARHDLEVIEWSQDLKLFKSQTIGSPVIMGSNTYETLTGDLVGRENIVLSRGDDPANILKKLSAEKCFVIGGGRTFARFLNYITDIYITPHPIILGKGVPMFRGDNVPEVNLKFERLLEFDKDNGIFQYQYKVNRPID